MISSGRVRRPHPNCGDFHTTPPELSVRSHKNNYFKKYCIHL